MNAPVVERADVRAQYAAFTARKALFFIIATTILLLMIPLAASLGAAALEPGEVVRAIAARVLPFLDAQCTQLASDIVWDLRLPRILMAIVSGAGLALSGASMQGIMRNPLVSPYTLGISAAAGFGAALAIVCGVGVLGSGQPLVVANAFFFGLLASALVFALARMRGMSSVTLILAGTAVMYLFSALTSFLQYIASPEQVHGVVFWLIGSLSASSWTKVLVVAIVLAACMPLLMKCAWDLNALSAGDDTAAALGTNVRRVRVVCMTLATLVSACVVSFCGAIGFICLVSPHIARMIIGSDHRYLLPSSCLIGAILMLASDTVARVAFQPSELPIGIMTAFVGVPFFIYLLLTRGREYF